MHGGGMPPGVRADFPGEQRWADFGRFGNSMRNDMPQAKTRETLAASIDEQRSVLIKTHRAAFQISFDGLNGFLPERTGALFPAFPHDADMARAAEAEVIHVQTHEFLSAHSGVVK